MAERLHFEESKIVYLAYKVSGNVKENLKNFESWYRWALLERQVIPICPWFSCCHALDDDKPEERAAGIQMDHAFLRKAAPILDEIWLCGPEVSSGMKDEALLCIELGIDVMRVIYKVEGPRSYDEESTSRKQVRST